MPYRFEYLARIQKYPKPVLLVLTKNNDALEGQIIEMYGVEAQLFASGYTDNALEDILCYTRQEWNM